MQRSLCPCEFRLSLFSCLFRVFRVIRGSVFRIGFILNVRGQDNHESHETHEKDTKEDRRALETPDRAKP